MKVLSLILVILFSASALAETERYLEMEYIRVYDGDTITVSYPILPSPLNRMRVRVADIDTPEAGNRARCPAEAEKAEVARIFLERLFEDQTVVRVYNFKWDKFGGRVLGDVRVPAGDVRDQMIAAGYAVRYSGTGSRRDWCTE